jgi:hypothetical protein
LHALSTAEAELASREKERSRKLTAEEKERLKALGGDLGKVWSATTTTDRERKELLRTLLEEVNIKIEAKSLMAHLTLRWRGGLISDLDLELAKRKYTPSRRTEEDTIELVRRLAQHYPDPMIAGILNRQGRRTVAGDPFTAHRVHGLRTYWKIPKFVPPTRSAKGKLVAIDEAADILGIGSSTLHRYLMDGFVAGEQLTPGAPWRIRITDDLRARFSDTGSGGLVSMKKAMHLLGVTRQTIMQRIKQGELEANCITHGKRKELRIRIPNAEVSDSQQLKLFEKGG